MSLLIGEHGEALLYGVVGIMLVCIICLVCSSKWKGMSPSYKTELSPSNREFANSAKDRYPTIESDDVIYADYKDTNFEFRDYVKAKDYRGHDISDDLKIFVSVDILKKNVYRLKCVVKSENLVCTKYVNVVVE